MESVSFWYGCLLYIFHQPRKERGDLRARGGLVGPELHIGAMFYQAAVP